LVSDSSWCAHFCERTDSCFWKKQSRLIAVKVPMSETAISVAMATYNGERFLQEQLDSLARQTVLPSELVVCDDGSTDGTLAILLRFQACAPFPVRIYGNERRLGAGFNFLRALGRCSGDLVGFCDQDDIWEAQKLSVCAEVMRDSSVALVSHSALVFSSRSRHSNTKPQPSNTNLLRQWRQPDHRPRVWRNYRDFTVQRWTLLGFSMVLRRTMLEKVRIPEYSAALSSVCAYDVWATIAALLCGRVVMLPDDLALHRLHEGNVSLRPPRAGLMRLSPDPRGLERGVENWAGMAQFFRYAASFCDEPARADFCEFIHQMERFGRVCGERALLHRACGHRWPAFRALFRMLAKGSYASRNLGAKAFVRDALLTACWPAGEYEAVNDP
jgi:glycosyltransferase involved in cell wall biosynthesis